MLEEIVKELHMDEKSVGMITCKGPPISKVYVDGTANQRGSGIRLILVSPEGITFEKSLGLAFSATNNEAKYEAVLVGMVNGLKKRLDNAKGRWAEELPHILWTYRTTLRRSTGETSFSMTYEAEAVIPLESGFSTLRTSAFSPGNNDGLLEKSLDLVEKRREAAMVQLAYYQQKLKRRYDVHEKLRPLTPRDLVLRKVMGTSKNLAWGKLEPTWEGPY
ncbi:uncharacterized protein LOC142639390 [Castanea sativa]|uniref:uncharacterized protein LOC142639390 n=1 Tax=Castanea sativa TaxID=21020 RepID=UPI003F64FD65